MLALWLRSVSRRMLFLAREDLRPCGELPAQRSHAEWSVGALSSVVAVRPGHRCFQQILMLVLVFSAPSLWAFGQNSAQPEKRLYVFDVNAYFHGYPESSRAWQYDVLNLLASLQGLVNRPEPDGQVPDDLLYLIYAPDVSIAAHDLNVDRYWLEKLRYPGELLAGYRIIEATDVVSLLLNDDIREHYRKVVLWDERVPATANVAATMCGVDGLLPVRYNTQEGSLFSQIVGGTAAIIAVGRRIVDVFQGYGTIPDTNESSTGSRKGDAYMWAKIQYLDTGRCDPTELACYPDGFGWDPSQPGSQHPDLSNACLLNHDFFISRKAFFFDLDPWWDERATDEQVLARAVSPRALLGLPEGVDETVLKAILRSAEQQTRDMRKMIRIGGFVPWWLKYSNYQSVGGKHDPSETQNEFIAITSSFNAFLESDAYPVGGLANASVFQHVKLERTFEQNVPPSPRRLEKKVYLLFHMGDYESAASLAQAVPAIWDDASRGRLPLAWGINPTLADRVPQVFNYLFRTSTSNDFFVGSRSGAGRLDPGFLLKGNRRHSGLEDGLDIWVKHNRFWYRKFDLQITGHVDTALPPLSQEVQAAFFSFSPHGVGTGGEFFEPLSRGLVPFCRHTADLSGLITPIDDTIKTIAEHAPKEKPAFQIYRCYLTTPTSLYVAVRELQRRYPDQYEVVDPYTFFYLLREHEGGSNNSIAYFRGHTIPQQMTKQEVLWCRVRMRNDGWDVWNPVGIDPSRRYRLAYSWIYPSREGKKEIPGRATTYIPGPVETGDTVDVDLQVEAPPYPMLYTLRLYLDREGVGPGSSVEEINVVVGESTG